MTRHGHHPRHRRVHESRTGEGRAADKRSDVWAFGCVFYEMLTGSGRSASDDVSDTLTRVLRDAPDWTAWPDSCRRRFASLVAECLQKNRRDRIADISTARFVMSERRVAFTEAVPPRLAVPHRSWKPRRSSRLSRGRQLRGLECEAFGSEGR